MVTFRPDLYKNLLRPILFKLPPEDAQKIADLFLRQTWLWNSLASTFKIDDPKLARKWCDIPILNPIGLAAGMDKDCRMLPSLANLGFGYMVAGTITASPKVGNMKPRMFRDVGKECLVNALGFPGKGLNQAAYNLNKARSRLGKTAIAASISGTTPDDILTCHQQLEPLVEAIEINISSPNTEGLKLFHNPNSLGNLLDHINDCRTKPLIVKIPPYPTSSTEDDGLTHQILSLVKVCVDKGVESLTVANSRPIKDTRLSVGSGGLSGRILFQDTLKIVTEVRKEAGSKLVINACGGIFSGEDAWLALKAGATTLQIYTALVYRGPSVVKNICHELQDIMAIEALKTVSN